MRLPTLHQGRSTLVRVRSEAHAGVVNQPNPAGRRAPTQTTPPRYVIVAGILLLVIVGVVLALLLRLDRMEETGMSGFDSPVVSGDAQDRV